MNRQARNNYANLQKRVQNLMVAKFVGGVYKALKSQISSYTSQAKRVGLQAALNQFDVIDPNMTKVIGDIHVKAGVWAAQKSRTVMNNTARKERWEVLELKRGGMGFNERMTRDILEYFRFHLLEKAVLPISQTTRDRIETVLKKGIEEGWGVDRILQELGSEEFLQMTKRRAETIVRTETVRASNYGALAAANDSEFEQTKVWIAVNDNRTRRTHKHGTGVDGQRVDLLQPFSNGLMFPGDPNGPAAETVNCRCAIAFRAKRDSQGRLIPKVKPQQGIIITLASELRRIYRRVAAMLNL